MERQGAKTGSPLRVELTRVVRAGRSRVFEAWTRPEIVHRWFGPEGMTAPVVKMDARVGAEYEIHCRRSAPPAEGGATVEDAVIRGKYLQIVPNELVQFTWCGNWDQTENSLVTVRLRDVEGGTEVALTHEQFTSERSREQHEKGWDGCFVKLSRFLEV